MPIYLCTDRVHLGLYIEADSRDDARMGFAAIPAIEAQCGTSGSVDVELVSAKEDEAGVQAEFRVTRAPDGTLVIDDLRPQGRAALGAAQALLALYLTYVQTFGTLSSADFLAAVGTHIRDTIAPFLQHVMGFDWVLSPRELDRLYAEGSDVYQELQVRRTRWDTTHPQPGPWPPLPRSTRDRLPGAAGGLTPRGVSPSDPDPDHAGAYAAAAAAAAAGATGDARPAGMDAASENDGQGQDQDQKLEEEGPATAPVAVAPGGSLRYTPPPWKAEPGDPGWRLLGPGARCYLGSVNDLPWGVGRLRSDPDDITAAGNALLMARAADMYQLLADLRRAWDTPAASDAEIAVPGLLARLRALVADIERGVPDAAATIAPYTPADSAPVIVQYAS